MHPIVVLLLDGLADRAHDVFGGRTANEAATTPNLDRLAAGCSCGLLYAVGPGRAPSSEVAHWSLLGYRSDEFPGRAVFEALPDQPQAAAEVGPGVVRLRLVDGVQPDRGSQPAQEGRSCREGAV